MEAKLTPGEHVIVRDAAKQIGADFLERMARRGIEAWESDPEHFDG